MRKAQVFLFAFAQEYVVKHDDKCQNRHEELRFKKLKDPDTAALELGCREDPARDRGAQVRAHNDADRLLQCHETGVNEADDHDRRSR